MLDVRHEVHVESLWRACRQSQKHFGLAGILASLPDGIRFQNHVLKYRQ